MAIHARVRDREGAGAGFRIAGYRAGRLARPGVDAEDVAMRRGSVIRPRVGNRERSPCWVTSTRDGLGRSDEVGDSQNVLVGARAVTRSGVGNAVRSVVRAARAGDDTAAVRPRPNP